MTRRTATLSALAIAALVVAAWLAWPRGGAPVAVTASAAEGATTPPTARDDAAAGAPMAASPPVAPRPSPAALLPADTELALVVAKLQPLAEAGDPVAACRLALELLDCRNNALMLAALDEPVTGEEDTPPAGADPAWVESFAHMQRLHALVRERDAACAALPADVDARADGWLTAAAHAGNVEAMLRYVDGGHLPRRTMHDFVAHPGFAAWRREAPAMLARLQRAGAPETIFLQVNATGSDFGMLGGLVADDPVRFAAYRELASRALGWQQPAFTADTDPRLRRQAEALAQRWHREHFGNRRFDGGASLRRLTWQPGGDDARIPCTD